MSYIIRTASPSDAAGVLAVYAPYVEQTTVSFEVDVPSVEEYAQRIEHKLAATTFIVLVDKETGHIAGFAYNGSFRERPAYDWASEISIYLSPEHQGRGLGSILLETLESLMRAQGVVMSEACITSSNAPSIAFHAKHGYAFCGEHHACGYKLGTWLDVTWMEKQLNKPTAHPVPCAPADAKTTARILSAANERLRSL